MRSTTIRFLKYSLLLCLLTAQLACTSGSGQQVRPARWTSPQGTPYSLFYPEGLSIQVVTTRPNPESSSCLLSVAAAYTDLETDQPLDLLVCSGRLLQATAKGYLDGALTITGNSLTISSIPKGRAPSRAQMDSIRHRHGTLLLQELLVFRGKNLRPAGGSLFQRRALVEFANHRFAVVESVFNGLTMRQFGDDLLALGAQNALYLDMGGWDEGWYKTSHWYQAGPGVVVLGNQRTQTARQSNWLVFARPAAGF